MQKHCLYVQVQIFLTRVTGFMQKEEPLIHMLYNQLKDLLLTILGRFCKQSLKADSHKLPIDQCWNQFVELKDHFGNPKYPTIILNYAWSGCKNFSGSSAQ